MIQEILPKALLSSRYYVILLMYLFFKQEHSLTDNAYSSAQFQLSVNDIKRSRVVTHG